MSAESLVPPVKNSFDPENLPEESFAGDESIYLHHDFKETQESQVDDCVVLSLEKYTIQRISDKRWQELFDEDGIREEYRKKQASFMGRDMTNQYRQSTCLALAGFSRGSVSQAYGWLQCALRQIEPELDYREQADNYNGNPVEQALLWLVDNFGLCSQETLINQTIESLRYGQLKKAESLLDEYING